MHIYFTKVFGKIKFEIGRNVIGVTKVEGFYLRKEFSKCFGDWLHHNEPIHIPYRKFEPFALCSLGIGFIII